MVDKLKVGIFFGGTSREREVSFAGGRTVYDNLDKSKFEALPIFVDSFNQLVLLDWEYVYKGSIRDFYPPTQVVQDGLIVNCLPDLPHGYQIYAESLHPDNTLRNSMLESLGKPLSLNDLPSIIDIAFLALHGLNGEDGSIQGILEWLQIPYTGSGIFASALGMNKSLQKQLQQTKNLNLNRYFTVDKKDWISHSKEQQQQLLLDAKTRLGSKFVIKPANQGSSLGVSILDNPTTDTFVQAMDLGFFKIRVVATQWNAKNQEQKIQWIKQVCDIRSGLGLPILANNQVIYRPDELEQLLNKESSAALDVLLEAQDGETQLILEEFIDGKEFSCIVVADEQGNPFALPPTEIRKSGAFFDYRSKYLPGLSNKVTPMEVDVQILENVREACCQLYRDFGFSVYARIDGFVNEKGDIFLNDPNTTSGMMPSSFFFHQAAEIGLNPSQFITLIIKKSLDARINTHTRGHAYLELNDRLVSQLVPSTTQSAKKKIGVIMGGYSFERHISMESGRNIYEKLSSSETHEPLPIFLVGDSQGYRLFELPISMMLKDNADDIRDKILNYHANPALQAIQRSASCLLSELQLSAPVYTPIPLSLEELAKRVEGVFIALHGRPGEDGTIQRDLAKYGLYHNGSLAHSSAITINKFETNKRLRELGFLVANHRLITKSDWLTNGEELIDQIIVDFGLPLIAKPADDGCSAAVRKVKSKEELGLFVSAIFRDNYVIENNLAKSLNIGPADELPQKNELLIEQFIDSKGAIRFLEVTGGLVTHINHLGETEYEMFEPSESLAESEILSLEEKFLAGQGQNITPARYSKNATEQQRISKEVRNTLEKVAKALDVTGYCRIDAFVRIMDDGRVDTIIIEINSLPGMTPATCIYHQAAINGYKPFEFIAEILKFGENRNG
jgi:D-alanine-D-alanine ligase